MQHQPNITMVDRRCCECGKYYFLEISASGQCPYCSQEKLDRYWHLQVKHEHVINGLRGALKRAKGKR
jgi:predicted Zn-ribbon and HTH transcriptional regulator